MGLVVFSARNWLVPVLGLIVVLAAALLFAGHYGAVERRVRWACGLLKLAGILTLALCLLEPLYVGQRARPGANLFALVVDNSQSLQIKDSGQAQSRGEILRRRLTNDESGWQAVLEDNFQVRRYTFDSQLQNTANFGGLDFEGHASALWHALRTASDQWRGQPVAGVLLFTDGNSTDSLPDGASLDGCPPVYPVIIGNESGLQDISLNKVAVSQTAFEDAPVTIQTEVNAHGFPGTEVVARVTEVATGAIGGSTNPGVQGNFVVSSASNIVSEQKQSTHGDDSDLNFRFQIQPTLPGIHFYQIDVRSRDELASGNQSREATLANNRQIVAVDRGQEPFRILYIGGRPNWEFKFLNRAIEDDHQVHMVSLIRVARREPKFVFKGREGESSNPLFRGFGPTDEETARYDQPVMIRLNTRDEFELRGGFPKTAEELFPYHAVIIGDLESDFFTHDQMVLLQRFVSERGGGFLMLGGAESFREGNYAGTAVASILPVYLDRPGQGSMASDWKLTLTREGWLQPWVRLRATEDEEKDRLEGIPPLEVLNSVRAIKPGASVLATVTDPNNNTHPALAVQRFGLGRTAAMMVGDLWRWGLRDESTQKDLAKSWRQLVRWLVADVPARVSIVVQPSAEGDPSQVRLVATARDEEFKPLENAGVQLTIRPVKLFQQSGENVSHGDMSTNYLQITAEAAANQPGKYEASYIAREAGAYVVNARVSDSDGKFVGQAAAAWSSDSSAEEFRSLKPNRALLEDVAKRTGGDVLTFEGLRSFARQLPNRKAPITESWSKPLWQEPLVFLFAIGCFVSEWGIRRWKGLP